MTPVSSSVITCGACGTKNRVPWTARGVPRCGKCESALPWVAEAGDDTFAEVAGASVLPVLVDIWAPWCGPCRMVSPVLQRLAEQLAGRIKLVKVNADDAPQVSAKFEARAIPTLLVMLNGEVLARRTGAAPEAELRRWLDGVLSDCVFVSKLNHDRNQTALVRTRARPAVADPRDHVMSGASTGGMLQG